MLVGRSKELTLLNDAFGKMLASTGGILFVTGEAGLGKTTLIREWWNTIAAHTALFVEFACSVPIGNADTGSLEPFQMWATILAGLTESCGKETMQFLWKKLVLETAPAWAWTLPEFETNDERRGKMPRHLQTPHKNIDHNPNAANQRQIIQQYANLLGKISEQTPLVIFLDDLHWSDTSSLNLLFHLSRQIALKRILILATYRPEYANAANKGKGHPVLHVKKEITRQESGAELMLSKLDSTSTREFMQARFPDYEGDAKFEQWILKLSGGNALFISQYLNTMREDNLVDARGRFVGSYKEISIPASTLAVVAERIRRLDRETIHLLRHATVEGEEFTCSMLSQLTCKRPVQLMFELQRSEKMGVVLNKGSMRYNANQVTNVYEFSHTLFHKVLYDGLSVEEQHLLHRKCFLVLREEWNRLSDANDRQLPLALKLITHAEKCDAVSDITEVVYFAAKQAWHHYAEAEALEMIRLIIHTAEHKEQASPERKKNDYVGEALVLQASIDTLRGRYPEALQHAEHAFTRFQTIANDIGCVAALNQQTFIKMYQSANEEAITAARKALAIAMRIGDDKGAAQALNNLGLIFYHTGRYEDALECHQKSLALRESIDDLIGIGGSLNNIGLVQNYMGAYDEALANYEKGLNIFESLSAPQWQATLLYSIGSIRYNTLAYDEALECFIKSMGMFESIGNLSGQSFGLRAIGETYHSMGNNVEALPYVEKSLALAKEINGKMEILLSMHLLGVINRNLGNFEIASPILQQSLELAREINARKEEGDTLRQLGILAEARAEFSDADTQLKRKREANMYYEQSKNIYLELKLMKSLEALEEDFARLNL